MVTKADKAALDELAEVDRKHKPIRTAAQGGVSVAAVTCVEFVLAYFNLDLDPRADGTQDSFPTLFTGALFVLGAWVAAKWMNRRPASEPDDEGQSVLIVALIAAAVCLTILLLLDLITVR